jgi:hypothetical protein
MILLHHIVQVFAGPNPYSAAHATLRFQFTNRLMRGGVAVQSDHTRWAVVSHSLAEEPLGSSHIAMFAQQEVHCLAVLVDGTIKIGPATLDVYICLITPPGAIHRPCVSIPSLFEFRNIALYPRRMVVCASTMPRSDIIWTKFRELSLKRRYQRTQRTMISWSKCRPLNRSSARRHVGIHRLWQPKRYFQRLHQNQPPYL